MPAFFISVYPFTHIFFRKFCHIKRVLQVEYGKIWCERVNRYINYFYIILTKKTTYGIIIMGYKTRLGEYKKKIKPKAFRHSRRSCIYAIRAI